jgi:hypothetical protein
LGNHRGRGGLNRAGANDLARGTEQAVVNGGRRLNLAPVDVRGAPQEHQLTVAVKHGHPQKVNLQQHQRVRSESPPVSTNQTTCHSFLFYRKNKCWAGKILPAPKP